MTKLVTCYYSVFDWLTTKLVERRLVGIGFSIARHPSLSRP
jgi:hypothetical protein